MTTHDSTSQRGLPRRGRRRSERHQRRARQFRWSTIAVVAVLLVIGGVTSVVSITRGPHVTDTQVDPAAAITAAGGRIIFTTDRAVAEITPEQVQVSPEVPFTVATAGRTVGVRFTVPLDDERDYTVTVSNVQSVGGGPSATLEGAFTTPSASVFLLQRDSEATDRIVRTDLHGDQSSDTTVFEHLQIDDFRATTDHLVVSVMEEGQAHLRVMNLDGSNVVDATLPGVGTVTGLQVSDQGDLFGYTYTDTDVSESTGRASVLYTGSLRDPTAEPVPLVVADQQPSIDHYRFVPDSSAILYIDFAGALVVFDPEADNPSPSVLGDAVAIDSISRGTYSAIVETLDGGMVLWDLVSGESEPLVRPDDEAGVDRHALPLPDGSTVRQLVRYDEAGVPQQQQVALVAGDGATTTLFEVSGDDAILQTCTSPSGRYVAVTVAPDLATNPYDYSELQQVPSIVRTTVVEIATGTQRVTADGFDLSWCKVGPW